MADTETVDFDVATRKTPYLQTYVAFKHDLQLLELLNNQIPKSIKERGKKENEDFLTKLIMNKDFAKQWKKACDAVDKVSKRIGKDRKNVYLGLKGKPGQALWKSMRHSQTYQRYFIRLIRDMSLIYLVADYEAFLQRILKISFLKKPEILKTCQKNITYEELLNYQNINDAKERIIEKELSIINEDIETVSQYLEEKFNLKISEFVDWKNFKERFYRRNIILHNLGMPNRLYRLKTGYKGKNRLMIVSKRYLGESIDLFNVMAIKVALKLTHKFP